jgi:muramoyltetrapeptide carboxypeptidase
MKATYMKLNLQQNIRPRALKPGDTIGVVAPAGPFEKDLFVAGVDAIHGMGFATKIDGGIFMRHGFLAGEDRHRAEHFNAMVADDGVQAIMCARGGYGSLRILDRLDANALFSNPKPLIGFSDITALHQAIRIKIGLITFHGPMVTTLARSNSATVHSWYDTLTGSCDLSQALSASRILKPGAAEGVLTGGNLATLCHMVGTPYGADYSGAILLIEDVGEAPYRIDRMLTQMKMAGTLEGLNGLIVGEFEDCGPQDEIDALIVERFRDMDIPIVSGVPIGHGKDNLTVPLGVKVRLDTQGPALRLLEPVFQVDEGQGQ